MDIIRASRNERDQIALTAQGIIAETYDRGTNSSNVLLTSGDVVFGLVGLRAGDVVSNIHCSMSVAGVRGASGAAYVGLYSKTGTRLAQSADATATFTGSTGLLTVTLSAAYTVTANDGYYLAVFSNFVDTQPTLMRGNAAGGVGLVVGTGARKNALQAGQSSLPASATLANGATLFWLACS